MLSDRSAPPLAIDADITDGTAVIRLRGDLDITASAALSAQLAEIMQRKPERVILDLDGVGVIDCASAGVIFSATSSLPGAGRPVIRSAGPLVRRLLEITGLDRQCILDGQPAGDAGLDGDG